VAFNEEDPQSISGYPIYAAVFNFTMRVMDSSDPVRADTTKFSISIQPPPPQIGDINHDYTINISDAVALINYVFLSGSAPDPLYIGDVNCDDKINLVDIMYLVNYSFEGVSLPCGK